MTNYKLTIEPGTYRVSPYAFWNTAQGFLIAARQTPPERFSMVVYFLFCQAIELALKAFLLHKRREMRELKDLGHNLVKLFARAEKLELATHHEINPTDAKTLEQVNTPYGPGAKGKKFQYFDVEWAVDRGSATLPDLAVLENLAARLIEDPRVKERYLAG